MIDFSDLLKNVSLISLLSLPTQQLTDIIKKLLNLTSDPTASPVENRKREKLVTYLSLASGMLTAILASAAGVLGQQGVPGIDVDPLKNILWILFVGLLSSAGSAFWNPVVAYLKAIKDIKTGAPVA